MDRRAIAVSGIVQGVGFRPFVYGLASRLGLHGFVKNQTGDVLIEVEGDDELPRPVPGRADLAAAAAGADRRGPLVDRCRPRGDPGFRIEPSPADSGPSPIFLSPDVATCDDCLARAVRSPRPALSLSLPQLHQLRPRLTIIRGAPYDRERTTMASFAMCAACRAEYDDPRDRRFHAQPIACPACGPRLRALDAHGRADRDRRPAGRRGRGAARGEDRRAQGPGRLPPGLRRRRRARPWRSCDGASTATRSRSPSWSRDLGRGPATRRGRRRPRRRCSRRRAGRSSCCAGGRRPRVADGGRAGQPLPRRDAALHAAAPPAAATRSAATPLVMTSGNRSDEPIAYDDRDALDAAGRHRRPVPDARPPDPHALRRLGDARRRRRRAAAPPLARLRPAAAPPARCRAAGRRWRSAAS